MLTAARTRRRDGASSMGCTVECSAFVSGRSASTVPPTSFCHVDLPPCTFSAAKNISSRRVMLTFGLAFSCGASAAAGLAASNAIVTFSSFFALVESCSASAGRPRSHRARRPRGVRPRGAALTTARMSFTAL